MGNEQSLPKHEPPRPEVPPQKSALSRSRSVSTGMAQKNKSRFLPNGLAQRRNDSTASTAGSTKNGDAEDGIESPQWGVSSLWFL